MKCFAPISLWEAEARVALATQPLPAKQDDKTFDFFTSALQPLPGQGRSPALAIGEGLLLPRGYKIKDFVPLGGGLGLLKQALASYTVPNYYRFR